MTVIGILLIVMAVFLVIALLMQSSKDHRHGGVVAGGAETFFGKQKGKSMDALFNKLTTVVAILFVVSAIALTVVSVSEKNAEEAAAEAAGVYQTGLRGPASAV